MSAVERLERAWYQGAPWLCLLWPLEALFRLMTALRRWLYRRGVLARYRPAVPVVVVGNITVGGTGKTPVVIALVEALQRAGLQPGVVSRGYGATAGHFPHRLDGQSTAAQAGDEPLLIFQRTAAACVVDPQRARAARELEGCGVDIIVSDDGLQHYGLDRDYEIAVLDAARGSGNGHCLPAGPLREPVSRLQRVQYRLYRGSDDAATGVRYRADALISLCGTQRRLLSDFAGAERVQALAGIGQPAQFFATLEAAGLSVQAHSFPDHHAYSAADFAALPAGPIIMTEKDAVKCRPLLPAGRRADAWFLRIDAELPQALLEQVIALARRGH
ncbi:tetraacyldisaccharide 4'-kinase [Parahaliea aestuarii]|uniref:Tetraacyldisaccharide 4'-kinase n=1 Tax=Parahaliea aestuarii TaxID=1852021 RepID=A0A5C8ZXF6_9GAMM|nr:tetraacyldisaccharide 4'-kinase [Parahaliea aestuarii]TXS93156.1 tetraacyldisaccharide 4'-kinase [Parahaliea aestuarii]